MEEIRPMAALALGVDTHAVKLPYDLLSVMNLSALWKLAGSDINTAQGAEVKIWCLNSQRRHTNKLYRITPTVDSISFDIMSFIYKYNLNVGRITSNNSKDRIVFQILSASSSSSYLLYVQQLCVYKRTTPTFYMEKFADCMLPNTDVRYIVWEMAGCGVETYSNPQHFVLRLYYRLGNGLAARSYFICTSVGQCTTKCTASTTTQIRRRPHDSHRLLILLLKTERTSDNIYYIYYM